MNSQSPRIDKQLIETLKLYQDTLGDNFFSHSMIIFTRFQSDMRTNEKRRNGFLPSKSKLILSYIAELKKALNVKLSGN